MKDALVILLLGVAALLAANNHHAPPAAIIEDTTLSATPISYAQRCAPVPVGPIQPDYRLPWRPKGGNA